MMDLIMACGEAEPSGYELELKSRSVDSRTILTNVLCAKCRSGMVYRRAKQLHVTVYCHALCRVVPADIVECTSFLDRKSLSIQEMTMIAKDVDSRVGVSDGSYK